MLNAVFGLYLYGSLAAIDLLIFDDSAHWLKQGAPHRASALKNSMSKHARGRNVWQWFLRQSLQVIE